MEDSPAFKGVLLHIHIHTIHTVSYRAFHLWAEFYRLMQFQIKKLQPAQERQGHIVPLEYEIYRIIQLPGSSSLETWLLLYGRKMDTLLDISICRWKGFAQRMWEFNLTSSSLAFSMTGRLAGHKAPVKHEPAERPADDDLTGRHRSELV